MLPKLDSIKQVRTRIGATQKALADVVGVSTSMINQIESGRSKPSYETARKIFDGLATLEGRSSSHQASDFCCKDLIKLRPSHTLHDAIKRMHEFSISQIPIFSKGSPVGLITEDGIMRYLAGLSESEMRGTKLAQIMDPSPPIVDHSVPARALVPLIRATKCILVSKKLRIIGIITASDTLRIMES